MEAFFRGFCVRIIAKCQVQTSLSHFYQCYYFRFSFVPDVEGSCLHLVGTRGGPCQHELIVAMCGCRI